MNQAFAIVIVIIAMFVGAGVVWMALGTGTDSSTIEASSDTEKLDAVLDRLEEMESRQSDMAREVSALRNADRGAPVSIGPGELDAAVERALARRMPSRGGMAPVDDAGAGEETVAAVDEAADKRPLAERLALLDDPNTSYEKRWELLTSLAAEGLIDDTIASLAARAEENAGDPEAHADLGEAYIAKLIGGKVTFMEQGQLSMKAHAAYDKALELEPDHWRSRKDKGTSYYWAPPQLGMQKQALEHLEHAARLQEKMKPQGGFADTYFMIGTLHERKGEMDKARAAWKRGLDQFPDSKQLRAKLNN